MNSNSLCLDRINLQVVHSLNSLLINFFRDHLVAVQETRLICRCKKSSPHPICKLHCVWFLSHALQNGIIIFQLVNIAEWLSQLITKIKGREKKQQNNKLHKLCHSQSIQKGEKRAQFHTNQRREQPLMYTEGKSSYAWLLVYNSNERVIA